MKTCKQCKTQVRVEANFCTECGAEFTHEISDRKEPLIKREARELKAFYPELRRWLQIYDYIKLRDLRK